MKTLALILGLVMVFLWPMACTHQRAPQEPNTATYLHAPDTVSLKVNENGFTSYDYYLNWRRIAKILYEDQDSSSLVIYRIMVNYVEKMKNNELDMSPDEVFVELANSFRTLKSENAKSRIDSLLVSVGYDPFYGFSSPQP